MKTRMEIRAVSIDDIPAIRGIYNQAILTTVATFGTSPRPWKTGNNGLLSKTSGHRSRKRRRHCRLGGADEVF